MDAGIGPDDSSALESLSGKPRVSTEKKMRHPVSTQDLIWVPAHFSPWLVTFWFIKVVAWCFVSVLQRF